MFSVALHMNSLILLSPGSITFLNQPSVFFISHIVKPPHVMIPNLLKHVLNAASFHNLEVPKSMECFPYCLTGVVSNFLVL